MKKILCTAAQIGALQISLSSALASADPGHGLEQIPGNSILHYITAPSHAVAILAIVALTLFTTKKFLENKPKNDQ